MAALLISQGAANVFMQDDFLFFLLWWIYWKAVELLFQNRADQSVGSSLLE